MMRRGGGEREGSLDGGDCEAWAGWDESKRPRLRATERRAAGCRLSRPSPDVARAGSMPPSRPAGQRTRRWMRCGLSARPTTRVGGFIINCLRSDRVGQPLRGGDRRSVQDQPQALESGGGR